MKLTISGEFTDLNTYVGAAKRHNSIAGKIAKAERTRAYVAAIENKLPAAIEIPLTFHFTWYCSHKRKDPDNMAFAKKFILDGLQDAKVIKNDGWNQVAGFTDSFVLDKENPRVELEIRAV